MKKELKYYLNLYLGCDCRSWNNVTNRYSNWRKMTCLDLNLFLNNEVKCEIALRKPSSITRGEVIDYMLITERYVPNCDGSYNEEQIEDIEYQLKEGGFRMRMTGNTFAYLTKQCFDVCGLIESGFARDKSTVLINNS